MFSATLTGVDRALGDLRGALDQELAAAALRAAGVVADDARQTHTFQNRTDALEEHIVPGEVRGSALDGTLEFDVIGETDYAGFVNDGTSRAAPYPFLEPAYEHQEDAVVAEFDQGLVDAARRAGW